MMEIGFAYFVFLPSRFTTPAVGGFVRRFGSRMTVSGGLAVALAGLPLLIAPSLAPVVAGLMLVGVGTFFAQAVATGFVGRVAMMNRGAASGLYLASYFSGGLVGSAVLGQIFDRFGWPACVLGIGLALAASLVLAAQMRPEAAIAGCLRRGPPTIPAQ
jgi:MFS family permease